MLEQIIKLFEEVLERDPGSVSADDIFRDYEEWDSLAYLSLISAIDETYGIVIIRDDFAKLRSIAEVSQFIQAAQA